MNDKTRIADTILKVISEGTTVIYIAKAFDDYAATYITPSIEKQLGYTPEEFLSHPEFWVNHIHPDDRVRVLEGLSPLFENSHHTHEYRFQHKDGSYRWMHDELTLLKNDDGTPLEIIGHWIDITERKQTELMLIETKGIAERANQAKSQFLSVMSHELRTPLTSIKGALGLLAGGVLINEPEHAQNMMRIANENSDRLKLLIDDILDFEKLESGKMVFHKEPIEVGSLIRKAVEINQGYADNYGIRFTVEENNCSSCVVFVDEHRLMQVFSNFLSNAVKYSPKDEYVRITSQCDNDKVRIAVIDQGEGIPEKFREHIFTSFSQADSSDTREKGGTGLGLVIAKDIIERHDGKVDYDSLPGQGTTFYFELNIN